MTEHTYEYWQAALQGTFGPVHDGDCQPGFWRKRTSRAGPFVPAATWEQDGQMVAVVDGKPTDASELWSFICRYPVAEAEYHKRVETGRWSDEDEAVTASLSPPASQAPGANNPPADPLEDLRGQIDTALAGVANYAKVGSDESAGKAQSLRSRLLDLSGDADKRRESLKRPHLEAGRAVDESWNPLVKEAKAGADALRTAISAFETEQKRKRDAAEAERQRLARIAAQEVEKARLEAEAAGKPAPEPPPPIPEPAPAPSTQVRGAYGKAASKKVVKKAIIQDYAKAVVSLSGHPEMKELVGKLAQRAVTAGVMVDGVGFEEVVDVK